MYDTINLNYSNSSSKSKSSLDLLCFHKMFIGISYSKYFVQPKIVLGILHTSNSLNIELKFEKPHF